MQKAVLRPLVAVLLFLAAVLSPLSAAAQAPADNGSVTALVQEQRAAIDALTRRTDDIEKRIDDNPDDDAKLVEARLRLEEIAREVINSSVSFRPRLTEINDRLALLGPAPDAGKPPEADIVADERAALTAEKARDQRYAWRGGGFVDPCQQFDRSHHRNAA